MAQALVSPGARVRATWRRLRPLPGGRWLFSRFLGFTAPYSGSVGALITDLEPGWCRAELRDRRRVRNHLNSIHAVAMLNLGELVTGLAATTLLPPTVRGIVTGLAIRYHKKARGTLTAECRCTLPDIATDGEHDVTGTIRDAAGDTVATVTATWRLGPLRAAVPVAAGAA